ncbi:MAG: hypothetical protein JRJ87_27435, partial [Deltaproteobacteria bacterium]|nr:hypothetical protein [Deltaproteobacteria bacterium]
DTSSSSLTKTRQRIWDAQSRGADLIAVDIMQTGAEVFISHEDNGATNGAHFQDVLADEALSQGDQILFIEMKEQAPNPSFLRNVLSAIQQHGYASLGRPVVLRSFYDQKENLLFARDLLATGEYEALRPHIRLHVLHGGNQGGTTAGSQDLMLESRANGFHGIEINYHDRNLFGKIVFARSLGMGTNIWTIPALTGEVFVAALREEVDALTVEYPVDKTRYVVQDQNLLAYLNVWNQGDSTDTVSYHRTGTETFEAEINVAGAPSMENLGAGHNRFGGSLVFDSSQQQSLGLYDADNFPNEGFLVTAVVDFDDLSLSEGETNAILNKADSGAFALELFNPSDGPTVLRFGVFVNGYRYATLPASLLNGEDTYLIIGAYDGDGSVRLWVDNKPDSVVTSSASGGVAQNDSPVVLGADPQGATGRNYFFSGKIQQAMVLSWGGYGH